MTHSTETQSSIPEEWLSGYLDGELSDHEQSRVTVALEESESLRAKLDELRGVSELLKSLPQPTLGADFASKLSLEPAVRRSAGLPWRFGMTAGSLVAASLVAGVLWIQSGQMQSPMEMASSDANPRLLKSASQESLVAQSAGALALELESSGASDFAMREAAPPAGRGLAFDTTMAPIETETKAIGSLLSAAPVTASLPRPGDLLPLLESNDGEVTVVEWAVLDVQEAFGQLQVTLSNMGVGSAEQVQGTTSEEGDLLAVFVQADETVMQAVIAQTQSQLNRLPAARMAIADPPIPASKAVAAAVPKPASRPEMTKPNTLDENNDASIDLFSAPVASTAKERRAIQEQVFGDEVQEKSFNLSAAPRNAGTEPSRQRSNEGQYGRFQYQVPMQLTQSSVDKIITNNSAYQAREPKRLLIVLKAAN